MSSLEKETAWNSRIPSQKFEIADQKLYVVILLLLSGLQTMEYHPVDPIDLYNYTHDWVNDDSTLSSKTELKIFVVITPFKKVYLNLENRLHYKKSLKQHLSWKENKSRKNQVCQYVDEYIFQ